MNLYWEHPYNKCADKLKTFDLFNANIRQYDDKFFTYFRMPINSFNELLEIVGRHISKTPISPRGNANNNAELKKGERFRRYLDENGVTKTLSQILVMLYRQEEKPEDPLRYVKDKLINDCTMDSCIGQLRSRILKATEENMAIQSNMQNLREQNNTLRQAIEKLTAIVGSVEIPTLNACTNRPGLEKLRCVSARSSRAKRTISCSGTVCSLVSSCNLSTRFPEIMLDDSD